MLKKLGLTAVAAFGIVASAHATTYTYVGSWQVDSGPSWSAAPLAYTGQETAALLFGGPASSYVTSTVDANSANIDFQSWVSTYGGACGGTFPCGTQVADDSVVSTGGSYLNSGDQSAYVQDWALGSQFTNFAFAVSSGAVPESATWAMMLVGMGAIGLAVRRRTTVSVSYA